jgi:mRNA interferase MazF
VQQKRQALVIARYEVAGSPALLWVSMVTSARHRRWAGDVEISDLEMAGLPASSIIRTAKIATIEMTEAERIGHLPMIDRPAIRTLLSGLLAGVLAA